MALLGGAALPLGPACDGKDKCEQDRSTVENCNRVYEKDPCAEPDLRCGVACYARVRCEDWPSIDADRYPPWLARCLSLCVETFSCRDDGHAVLAAWRCDGEKDCVDGSDEQDCDYLECANGELVRVDSACDGFDECRDQSDELGCP